jgi:hypothetical protein
MSCPVCKDNLSPFSSSHSKCQYHRIGPGGLAEHPQGSHRIRRPYRIEPAEVSKLRFSVPGSQSALNLLVEDQNNASVFHRNIYAKEPMASRSPSLEGFRDKTLLYTYAQKNDPVWCKERDVHPEIDSRFGYNRFPNNTEYGTGMQSRGYIEPAECHDCANDTPKNMAPQRFYTDYHMRSTPTEFRKMIDQRPLC